MNQYVYDEIEVGQTVEFSKIVTDDMMKKFLSISGDINPMHNDEKFAKEHGFQSKIVYGMLTASLYSTLAGVYMPGKNCLLHSVHADFLKPVFIGDILHVKGFVKEKHDVVKQIIIKAIIRNQYDDKVSKATIEVGVL